MEGGLGRLVDAGVPALGHLWLAACLLYLLYRDWAGGSAPEPQRRCVKIGAPLIGLCLAIFAHSLHNTLLTFLSGLVGLTAAAVVAWTGWLVMFAFILYLIYREKTWLAEYLREEVRAEERLPPSSTDAACSFFGQTRRVSLRSERAATAPPAAFTSCAVSFRTRSAS